MLLPATSTVTCSRTGESVIVQAPRVCPQPRDKHPPNLTVPQHVYHQCHFEHCNARDALSLCSGCKLVRYCSKVHQSADWGEHKPDCGMLKDLYDEVVKWQGKLMAWALGLEEFEDPALQNRTAADGEIAPVGSPEKTIMGKFSKFGYLPCKYLEARRIFQFVTGKYFATLDGVQQSYDQAMNLLILDRADKYKARYSAPFLMLMLGKDQTCYDFLKWYITVAPTYDFSNVDLPFLDIHNADPLESVDYIVRACPEEMDLSVLVAMYLIKMRLNLDQARIHAAVDEAMEKGNVTSQTLSDLTNANPIDMKNVLLTSSIVATNPFLHDYRALEPAQRQCQKLHVLIHCRNKHFFRMLFDKKRQWDREFLPNFLQNPTARGSEDEAYYVVKEAILAFAISDGALEITKLANRSLEGLQGEE